MTFAFKTKEVKREKGSITLFTLVAMLFFITVLILLYTGQMGKINSQKKQLEQIQQEYNIDDEIEGVYNRALESIS